MKSPSRRIAAALVLMLCGVSCAAELEAPAHDAEALLAASPATRTTYVGLAAFEGRLDPARAELHLALTDVLPADGHGPRGAFSPDQAPDTRSSRGLRVAAQPLYCEIRESRGFPDTVSIDSDPDTFRNDPESCGYSGFPYDVLGMFCFEATITSHFSVPLRDVTAVLVEVTPPDLAAYAAPFGNGADLSDYAVGPGLPTDLRGGAFAYGDLPPGESRTVLWTYRGGDEPRDVDGVIVARVEETDNGLDDDCDGRVDEGLGAYAEGTPCVVDEDCASSSCIGEGGDRRCAAS